jgi:hypothetical protein
MFVSVLLSSVHCQLNHVYEFKYQPSRLTCNSPFGYYWEILSGAKGTCVDEGAHLLTSTIMNVFIDLVILILPIKTLLALKIRTIQKIQVIAVFGAGIFVVVSSAVKVYYVHVTLFETYDVTCKLKSCLPFAFDF